jgi:hypothetical protein
MSTISLSAFTKYYSVTSLGGLAEKAGKKWPPPPPISVRDVIAMLDVPQLNLEGSNIGGFKTNSDVLVAGPYMYFQGTDQAVWKVAFGNPMSERNNFGGPDRIKTKSNVFYDDGFVYFRGTDDKVWQMNVVIPPFNPVNIGGFKTNSDIFVADGYMYFQGTDQAVWRVSVADPEHDRNNFGGPDRIKTKSNVFYDDGFVYFRGTDDKVWQMSLRPPYDFVNIGGFKTNSNVFIANGYIYFQGTDQAVWRVSVADPDHDRNNFGGPDRIKTQSDVYALDGEMYFRGTDDKVWQMSETAPYNPSNVGGLKTHSNIFPYRALDGTAIYFQGTDNKVWCYDFGSGALREYANRAVYALMEWYNSDNGQWDTTNWWNWANVLHALIDYLGYSIDRGYAAVVGNTFDKCKSQKDGNFLSDKYDDQGWWALTWIRAHDFFTGDEQYLAMAKVIFDNMTRGWDSVCDGGIYWQKNQADPNGKTPYKNAIANELFLAIAVQLFQRSTVDSEKQTYRDWITKTASWFAASQLINPSHLVNDGLTTDDAAVGRCVSSGPNFSYTQGVILGALVDMYTSGGFEFGGHDPLGLASSIASAVIAPNSPLTSHGILIEPGDSGTTTDDPDHPQFKGIFMRNLARLANTVNPGAAAPYIAFIRNNVRSILANDRNTINQLGYAWTGPFDTADAARQSSALDAINAAITVGTTV